MNLPSSNVCVVAHDAGGANLVAAWALERRDSVRFTFVLSGPALRLFEATLGPVKVEALENLRSLPPNSTLLVCATSRDWRPVVSAVELARELGIRSAAYLDHWMNYPLRFGGGDAWQANLPDEVWVADRYAWDIALREGFPASKLRLKGNPYLDQLAQRVRHVRNARERQERVLLYVTEPIAELLIAQGRLADEYGYTEFSLLDEVLTAVQQSSGAVARVIIRPHPSESAQKYAEVIARHRGTVPVSVSWEPDLAADLAQASVTVGAHSMALVAAMAAGLKAVSYIPENGRPCMLPHDGLERVSSVRSLARTLERLFADEVLLETRRDS